MNTPYKNHWDRIYSTKQPEEVSWTQKVPRISLEFIHGLALPKSASIIDIGGGESTLVDNLLDEGYSDITVLDISERALEKTKQRLGEKEKSVRWVVSDVTGFQPEKQYDLWHDRAAFHFLIEKDRIERYVMNARRSVKAGGFLIIGTFSLIGPKRCSGLDTRQYSEESLQTRLATGFKKLRCMPEDHVTPSGKVQNFLFCSFQRLADA